MKIVKKIIFDILVLMAVFIMLMITPRLISFIFQGKMPVGYHFIWADMLAVGVGLEKLIDETPEIPSGGRRSPCPPDCLRLA